MGDETPEDQGKPGGGLLGAGGAVAGAGVAATAVAHFQGKPDAAALDDAWKKVGDAKAVHRTAHATALGTLNPEQKEAHTAFTAAKEAHAGAEEVHFGRMGIHVGDAVQGADVSVAQAAKIMKAKVKAEASVLESLPKTTDSQWLINKNKSVAEALDKVDLSKMTTSKDVYEALEKEIVKAHEGFVKDSKDVPKGAAALRFDNRHKISAAQYEAMLGAEPTLKLADKVKGLEPVKDSQGTLDAVKKALEEAEAKWKPHAEKLAAAEKGALGKVEKGLGDLRALEVVNAESGIAAFLKRPKEIFKYGSGKAKLALAAATAVTAIGAYMGVSAMRNQSYADRIADQRADQSASPQLG